MSWPSPFTFSIFQAGPAGAHEPPSPCRALASIYLYALWVKTRSSLLLRLDLVFFDVPAIGNGHRFPLSGRVCSPYSEWGYCSRFQTKLSMESPNRKSVIAKWMRLAQSVLTVWQTRSHSRIPLPVCCHHGGKHLESTSPTWNSCNSSKNLDQRIRNHSETPPLVMIHHVDKRSKTTGPTSHDLLVWSLIMLIPL